MAASDDLRFQCYLLDGREDERIELLARALHLEEDTEDYDHYDCLPEEGQFLFVRVPSKVEALSDAKHFLEHDNAAFFILWDGRNRDVIGRTKILHANGDLPHFHGTKLVSWARGMKLSKLLHSARVRFLQESGYVGLVDASIVETNTPSIAAATSFGFHFQKAKGNIHSYEYYVPSLQTDLGLNRKRQLIIDDPKPRVENW